MMAMLPRRMAIWSYMTLTQGPGHWVVQKAARRRFFGQPDRKDGR
jgi:hypothetical protein